MENVSEGTQIDQAQALLEHAPSKTPGAWGAPVEERLQWAKSLAREITMGIDCACGIALGLRRNISPNDLGDLHDWLEDDESLTKHLAEVLQHLDALRFELQSAKLRQEMVGGRDFVIAKVQELKSRPQS
jgi:hypothetical protein